MDPYSSVEAIGGAQAAAAAAGYIDPLEISIENGRGTGDDFVSNLSPRLSFQGSSGASLTQGSTVSARARNKICPPAWRLARTLCSLCLVAS